MHIFISHSSSDAQVAQEICNLIENNNSTCFIAPRDIRSGKEYAEEIINGINQADAMILIMSNNANKSPHVLREVERAVSRSIPILVYKLEDVALTKSMEYFLMTHQWITSEKKRDYKEILNFIKEHEDSSSVSKSGDSVGPANNKKSKKKLIISIIGIAIFVIAVVSIVLYRQSIPSYELGDTIIFGSYNGQPIEWRVLKLSENHKEAILISKDILTMKAYDSAEGGSYNRLDGVDYWTQTSPADSDLELQIQVRGNSDWSVSNIRTWLNSSAETVIYTDQAPTAQAMSEGYNGYHNEVGFLSDFTAEELDALLEADIATTGNALSENKVIITTDRVFLLSQEELKWFEEAGISLFAIPTENAITQDDSNWYDVEVSAYDVHEYYWWLREPVPGTSSQCYMVTNGYTEETLTYSNVGTEGFGIRPAIYVNLTSDVFK